MAEILASFHAKVPIDDDHATVYEPWNQDGTYNAFRAKAPEHVPESFKNERSSARFTVVPAPAIRRLVSVAKSRKTLRQKQELELLQPSAFQAKKVEDHVPSGISASLEGLKQAADVETEAEDSEVSSSETITVLGRPTFAACLTSGQEPDACTHLRIAIEGPLRPVDEPPDFLQLPEPIKQRTAGAVRVAAAARAWAAASIAAPPPQSAEGAVIAWQNANLPLTARRLPPPGNAAATIAAELQRQGHAGGQAQHAGAGRMMQANNSVESREVVAGPAVLALRRMRNGMSALADVRLPFFNRTSGEQIMQAQPPLQAQPPQQPPQPQRPPGPVLHYQNPAPGPPMLPWEDVQPQPPQQPNTGQRRPLLPNLGARSAAASGGAVPSGGAAESQSAAGPSGAHGDLGMQSLVPAAPNRPKPPAGSKGNGFWRRSFGRVSINLNPFSSGASGGPPGSGSGTASQVGGSPSPRLPEEAG